jgi:hypothetical protein
VLPPKLRAVGYGLDCTAQFGDIEAINLENLTFHNLYDPCQNSIDLHQCPLHWIDGHLSSVSDYSDSQPKYVIESILPVHIQSFCQIHVFGRIFRPEQLIGALRLY